MQQYNSNSFKKRNSPFLVYSELHMKEVEEGWGMSDAPCDVFILPLNTHTCPPTLSTSHFSPGACMTRVSLITTSKCTSRLPWTHSPIPL